MSPNSVINIDTVEYTVEGMRFDIPNVSTARLVTADGELRAEYGNRAILRGKHGVHSVRVRTKDSMETLCVEGSLGGFLYGQNLFTSDDMGRLCFKTLQTIAQRYGWDVSVKQRTDWRAGGMQMQRVDLACNFALDSEEEVKTVLDHLRFKLPAHGCSVKFVDTSAYFQPDNGKDYEIVFYAKGPQMRRETKLRKHPDCERLLGESSSILRVEVRLRGALKQMKLARISDWKAGTADCVFWEVFRKISLPAFKMSPVTEQELAKIPFLLKPVLANYRAGMDLKSLYTVRTLQRHKRAFKALGLDLNCPFRRNERSVPLHSIFAREKALIAPSWLVTSI